MTDTAELLETLKRYKFHHVIDLGNGMATPGNKIVMPLLAPVLEDIRRRDLRGKRVLDIGCWDGLFCFEAERQGGQVLGIENGGLSAAAVEFLIPWFKSSVEMRALNLLDLKVEPHERFDYVICAGVLYHLRTPFHGLKVIADAMVPGGVLLIETGMMLSPYRHPFLYAPASKDSPYDPTSVSFFNHQALVNALESMGFDQVECRAVVSPSPGWPRYGSWDEFLSSGDSCLADTDGVVIGRGTYTCRRADNQAESASLKSYWFGTHKFNSDAEKLNEFRAQYGFEPSEQWTARVAQFAASPKRRGWLERLRRRFAG
jgi:SAM-dependent methyltransferase